MDSDHRSRKQVSLEQLKSLLDFLQEHQELARGLTRGRRGKLLTLKIWNECAELLNAIRNGATKDGKGWSKYWCDWKYRVRRRALELKVAVDTNRQPPEGILPLSEMEEIIISIIGDNAIDGVVIKTDPPADGDSEEDQHVEVKEKKRKLGVACSTFESDCREGNQSPRSRKQPRLEVDASSDSDDGAGPSSPAEKPRFTEDEEIDETTLEFLRIEERKLENSQRMSETMEGIRTQISRIGDILVNIRDVLVNNRSNI